MAAFGLAAVIVPLAYSQPQPPIRIKVGPPKPEPVAETKLLMDGIAQPNFKGLGKILKEQPKEVEAWAYARGQALLIGETANLLMLRPPQSTKDSQDLWLTRAADLREAAARLALAATGQDYLKSRAGLADVANACNRCHQSFRVAARVVPFAEE